MQFTTERSGSVATIWARPRRASRPPLAYGCRFRGKEACGPRDQRRRDRHAPGSNGRLLSNRPQFAHSLRATRSARVRHAVGRAEFAEIGRHFVKAFRPQTLARRDMVGVGHAAETACEHHAKQACRV
jgi:hypothetical protein